MVFTNETIIFFISVKIPSDIFVRAGYSANAEIMLEQAIDVLTIPESCLEFSNDSAFVYLLTKDEPQEFKKTVVKTGLSDGINIQLTQGLKLGEKIRGAEIVEKKKENVN